MPDRRPHIAPTRFAALTSAAVLIALAGGCGGGAARSSSGSSTQLVTAENFVAPVAAQAAPAPAVARPATPAPATAAPDPEPVLDTTAVVGEPAPARPDAAASRSVLIVESLVGQVNGRPVFASEVIEPLDAQLRAEARKASSRDAWRNVAIELFNDALSRIIKDELILAEARASLTPEQRQGLFNFLSRIQEDVVSQQRGSAVAADEALRSGAGLSLQQAAKDRLDRELIANEIRQRISPRVIVSWRQIQQEYERNLDKYQPPSTATFRMIVAAAGSPEAEQIAAQLAQGIPFSTIADSDLNILARAREKGRLKAALTGAPDQQLTGIPEVDAAAKPLTPGSTAGPITTGDRTRWITLESIDQPPATSLYDAQLDIEYELSERRFRAENARYFDRILKRGNVSDFRTMGMRLLAIAEQRYFGTPASSASPAAPAR